MLANKFVVGSKQVIKHGNFKGRKVKIERVIFGKKMVFYQIQIEDTIYVLDEIDFV